MKTVEKPWGQEKWISYDNGRYAGKIIGIDKGKRLSKQYHKIKHETLFILTGKVEIELNEVTKIYYPKDVIVIPEGTIHRIKGLEDTVLIEFSSPELDDCIRLEDDYGRV